MFYLKDHDFSAGKNLQFNYMVFIVDKSKT